MSTADAAALEGTTREVLGKAVRHLRKQGLTPANLYGRGVPSIAFQVSSRDLDRLIAREGRAALVTLSIDGASHRALLRGLQRHPVTRAIQHAEFYRVDMTRAVQTQVPVHIIGEAPAARLPDALVQQIMHEVEIECLPGDIPPAIEVDISGLTEIGASIQVQDVTPPAGVTLLADGEQVIVQVGHARVSATGAPEGTAEPGQVETTSGGDAG